MTADGVGVMHLIDALDAGGAERVAVNLVNLLPRTRFRLHLCTTRRGGPLEPLIASDVGRLRLSRQRTVDAGALGTLWSYIRHQRIRILHAHETSLFIATAVAMLPPFPRVVWHDHFGRHGVEERSTTLYGIAARRARAVISVTRPLADWATTVLRVPQNRVHYLPNFVAVPSFAAQVALPGVAGNRIVCVANFRPQKDHLSLLRAMPIVLASVPAAHLLLVGDDVDAACAAAVRAECVRLGLDRAVTFLGRRDDVADVLHASDVGVLSSMSEGLPLALIEYGHAALATVATRVGECPEVLSDGALGALVPPADPEALAAAIVGLLRSPQQRAALGGAFQVHVQRAFSAEAGLSTIASMYDLALQHPRPGSVVPAGR